MASTGTPLPGNVALILTIGQLVTTLAPIGIELALKIKALLQPLGVDIQMNIQNLGDDAIAADDDTIARVNAFLSANGMPTI
jgi:hypothetical protein